MNVHMQTTVMEMHPVPTFTVTTFVCVTLDSLEMAKIAQILMSVKVMYTTAIITLHVQIVKDLTNVHVTLDILGLESTVKITMNVY